MTQKQENPLKLFNSWSRDLEVFEPLDPSRVRIYSCGPTVYNYAHLGNLRAYVFTDVLRRTLNWKGYPVVHVINITDVGHLVSDADEGEDKMEVAAKTQGKTIWEIAAHYTQAFKQDIENLNILSPSVWSTATDHVQEMISFASNLEDRGYTYELPSGLYFDTSKLKDYGWLGRINVQGQQEGARVKPADGKRQSMDFAIWRHSPEDQQRQMEWNSPWGPGAPGWHLECSVMSMKYLGEQFDIHTGGIDHREIHHCNEIAQNQAFTGSEKTGANIWMHNAFLVDKTGKMSKSKGGFVTLQKLIACGVHPLAYRLLCLSGHYRKDIDFSDDIILSALSRIKRIAHHIQNIRDSIGATDWMPYYQEASYSRGASLALQREMIEKDLSPQALAMIQGFDQALSDDLMLPEALPLIEKTLSAEISPEDKLAVLASFDLVLGLRLPLLTVADFNLRPASASMDDEEVDYLLEQRAQARASKDYSQADAIRDQLMSSGVEIMDKGDTTWAWVPDMACL